MILEPIDFADPTNTMTGYVAKTTFWLDFSIAERFGEKAIRRTFDGFMTSFGDNYEFMTELALTTNHKLNLHFKSNKELAKIYEKLWVEVDNYVFEHFKDNEKALSYYLHTTD